ncbi:hypothetical protein B0H66DRAFT_477034 [Apodospora peruviana]|uniref:Rhodanese domain-containing protein n=1 Tax=Apodospora peruviana TaxID=516989 RepID=A0AAE0I4N1_9PEZI|nr:hypothetical protein B0H66DRAFT_477034 [Apodospora peruviana]
MATTTIGTLNRLSASALSKMILAEQVGDPTIAIVDVRDDDYIGGHIKGALNFPSRTLDAMLPTLIRQLQDKQTVVFHCALSQQRGPGAALRYIRERDRLLASDAKKNKKKQQEQQDDEGAGAGHEQKTVVEKQVVYVLDRGFVGWQEVYGTDERLTEGYRKELWEDGYWG